MKNPTKKIVAGLSAFALILSLVIGNSGCKKKEDTPEPEPEPAPVPLTNTQKLSGKNFKTTAMTVDPGVNTGSVTITDWYAQMSPCEKDDLINFNTAGTYVFDEGPSKCNASDPQTVSGTWLWNTNETILSVKEGTTTVSFNVLVNDGTTLKYTYTENYQGTNYVFTTTRTKQ